MQKNEQCNPRCKCLTISTIIIIIIVLCFLLWNFYGKSTISQTTDNASKRSSKQKDLKITFTKAVKQSQKKQIKVKKIKIPASFKAKFDFLPSIVAESNGKKLTKEQLIKEFFDSMDGKISPNIDKKILVDSAKFMATNFLQSTAMLDAAIKAGYKPSVTMAVKGFEVFLRTAPAFEIDQLKKRLAKEQISIETFLERNKTKKQFQNKMTINYFLEKEVISKSKVSEKEAKAYYDAHPQAFSAGTDPEGFMRASHILIKVDEKADVKTKAAAKAKAEKLLALLKKDASLFGELAEKQSECPSSKDKGSLGAFSKGKMVPEFEKAVVNLKSGEISAIVETQFGYHIIRRDALKKSKKEAFNKVKNDIQKLLKEQDAEKYIVRPFIKKTVDEAKGKNYIK